MVVTGLNSMRVLRSVRIRKNYTNSLTHTALPSEQGATYLLEGFDRTDRAENYTISAALYEVRVQTANTYAVDSVPQLPSLYRSVPGHHCPGVRIHFHFPKQNTTVGRGREQLVTGSPDLASQEMPNLTPIPSNLNGLDLGRIFEM